jgi:catechol 2,3-dioxygenase
MDTHSAPHAPSAAEIAPGTCIGHVHLKVADLDRALLFWRDILGFRETQRYGDQAVFLSAGGYHHHIGLNTWESRGAGPRAPGTTGLEGFVVHGVQGPATLVDAWGNQAVLEG